jgi:hypothetical protein
MLSSDKYRLNNIHYVVIRQLSTQYYTICRYQTSIDSMLYTMSLSDRYRLNAIHCWHHTSIYSILYTMLSSDKYRLNTIHYVAIRQITTQWNTLCRHQTGIDAMLYTMSSSDKYRLNAMHYVVIRQVSNQCYPNVVIRQVSTQYYTLWLHQTSIDLILYTMSSSD